MNALRFAVLGDPIAHSKSPVMHRAAFAALGMPHRYDAIRCSEAELGDYVARLRSGEFAGFNVTIPHKQSILKHVDEVDAETALIGAANTLARIDVDATASPNKTAKVIAYNTDAPALASELALLSPETDWRKANVLVLGSGGAARSAIVALALRGVRLRVRARAFNDSAKRGAFDAEIRGRLRSLPGLDFTAEPWRRDRSIDATIDAIVQTTSAGMRGADAGDAVVNVVAWDALHSRAACFDTVYEPRETAFLRVARERGVRAANGLGMLARQGALAFERWLGVAPPLEVMVKAIQ